MGIQPKISYLLNIVQEQEKEVNKLINGIRGENTIDTGNMAVANTDINVNSILDDLDILENKMLKISETIGMLNVLIHGDLPTKEEENNV